MVEMQPRASVRLGLNDICRLSTYRSVSVYPLTGRSLSPCSVRTGLSWLGQLNGYGATHAWRVDNDGFDLAR